MPIQATDPVYLAALSPKDKRWDERRSEADGFRDLYRGTEFDSYALRLRDCAQDLEFAFAFADTGEGRLKLQAAKFCRVRHCPVCQWRRSLMWRARAFTVLPKIIEDHPKSRFIFLTLTVKNCQLSELRDTLAWMNNSWKLLTKRKEWPAQGWIKAVEVTRGHDDTAHPHFHCLLMVRPSYFTTGYLSHQRWTELWQGCLKVGYSPMVNIQVIKPPKGTQKGQEGAAMLTALCETLKYSVKPSDILIGDEKRLVSDKDWLVELTTQLHKTRAVATGGLLKTYMKELEEEPEDLIHVDDDGISESDDRSPRVAFGWREKAKRYRLKESC